MGQAGFGLAAMAAGDGRIVTVFGGTGFLGRRVVSHLRGHGFAVRIASRHPERGRSRAARDDPQLQAVAADIHDQRAVAAALAGAWGAVNAVSLYVEHGRDTFHSVHVEAAGRLAAQARAAGVERLAHVSGIGADPASRSRYIRSRGEGEGAVRAAFAQAAIIRPAVMFAADDAFLTAIRDLVRRLPVYPLFGRGDTRLQPAHADDVAEGLARALARADAPAAVYECAGPRVYRYEELVRTVARAAGRERTLLPMPFAAWHALAFAAELLPGAPITRNQVELMEIDTVASAGTPGFAELGISPRSIEDTLPELLRAR
jgi:NADH dehydrogenase